MSWRPPRSPSEEARELEEALAASLAELRLEGVSGSSSPAAAAAAAAAAEPEGEPAPAPQASAAPWAVEPAGVVHLPPPGARRSWAQAATSNREVFHSRGARLTEWRGAAVRARWRTCPKTFGTACSPTVGRSAFAVGTAHHSESGMSGARWAFGCRHLRASRARSRAPKPRRPERGALTTRRATGREQRRATPPHARSAARVCDGIASRGVFVRSDPAVAGDPSWSLP